MAALKPALDIDSRIFPRMGNLPQAAAECDTSLAKGAVD
jgi:hypothetical protein